MKIISKFNDYYDAALGFGHDYSLIYKREQIKIDEKQWSFAFKTFSNDKTHNPKPLLSYTNRYSWKALDLEYRVFLIGFCGKIYPGAFIKFSTTQGTQKEYVYNPELLYKLMETEGIERVLYKAKDRNRFNKHRISEYDKVEKFFNADYSFLEHIFYDYKVPVFAIECPSDYYSTKNNGSFVLNPTLKEYNFQLVVPHLQAFQQIEQYLSGVIGAEGPILYELSDKEKITKAGFDKWSFRTMPSKR